MTQPEKLYVQLFGTPQRSVVAYVTDPREVHDNGKPVYVYVPVEQLAAALRERDEARQQKQESENIIAALTLRLMRINVNYRSGSELPLRLQAYCMRSEAKVALGIATPEEWDAELAQIEAAKPYAEIERLK